MDTICDDLTLYDHMSRTSSAQSEAYDQEACDRMSRTCSAESEAHDQKYNSSSAESDAHDRMPRTSSAQSEASTSSVLSRAGSIGRLKSFAKRIKDAGSKLVEAYVEAVEKYADNNPDSVYWSYGL